MKIKKTTFLSFIRIELDHTLSKSVWRKKKNMIFTYYFNLKFSIIILFFFFLSADRVNFPKEEENNNIAIQNRLPTFVFFFFS